MDVKKMIDRVVSVEGGYSDHPSDRGGPTKYGITEQTARAYGYRGSMRDMPRHEAIRIYEKIYWLRPGFDRVADLSEPIAEELFDTGVNMGPKRAAGFLQRALNVLNRRARDYGDIVVDSDIGPATLYALKTYLAKRGGIGEMTMLKALDILQGAKYIELAEGNASQEDFVYGWIANRIGQ